MRVRTRVVALVAPLLAPALMVGTAPPTGAQQDARLSATATISAPAGVLYAGCFEHPVGYTVDVDPSDTPWLLDVDTSDPTGARGGSNQRRSSAGDQRVGSMGVELCSGSLEPGTFALSGVLTHGAGVDPVTPSTFTMRNPRTRTRISASTERPRRQQQVVITARSREEMPGGYQRKRGARVVLQRDVRSTWVKVLDGGSARTDDRGRARFRFVYPGHMTRLRVVTRGSADWDGSRSRVLILR